MFEIRSYTLQLRIQRGYWVRTRDWNKVFSILKIINQRRWISCIRFVPISNWKVGDCCILLTLWHFQAEIHQKRYEQERRALKLRVSELENKLAVLTQDLEIAKSTIESKTSDMLLLQNNLKELEELREMKEVLVLSSFLHRFVFVFIWMMIMYFPDLAKIETRDNMFISLSCF